MRGFVLQAVAERAALADVFELADREHRAAVVVVHGRHGERDPHRLAVGSAAVASRPGSRRVVPPRSRGGGRAVSRRSSGWVMSTTFTPDERVAHLVAEHLVHRLVRADDRRPTGSTSVMPMPASSNAWRNTSCAWRSAASDCLRSEMSRRFATQPSTLGSSNRFVNVTSNQRHDPSWWRRRVSTRADAASSGVSSSSCGEARDVAVVHDRVHQHADRLVRRVAEHLSRTPGSRSSRSRRTRRRG